MDTLVLIIGIASISAFIVARIVSRWQTPPPQIIYVQVERAPHGGGMGCVVLLIVLVVLVVLAWGG